MIQPITFAFAMFISSTALAVEIVAHRGASHDAPENTLSAFRLGFAQEADAVELDVHLTKDGKIVVSHDAETGRTAGVTNRIAERSFDELRKLEVGRWGRWRGKAFKEFIPALDEVMPLVPAGKKLFIEIKCGAEILPELENVLNRAAMPPEQTVIIGFSYDTMCAAKGRFPKIMVLWLVSSDSKTKKYPPVEDLIEKTTAAKLDGLNLNFGFPIDREFVRKVRAAGLRLYTWTVDDVVVAKREAEAGVDGITTNRPGWLRAELKR
jgi:glycerophosphoryl diester phosphodiesterase